MESTNAQKVWKQKDYLDKKPYYQVRDSERYLRFRAILIEAKKKPCADCGGEFPACAMDLHHRDPATKIRNVSALKHFSSEEKLVEEIAKCDVLCACCHRIREDAKQAIGK